MTAAVRHVLDITPDLIDHNDDRPAPGRITDITEENDQ